MCNNIKHITKFLVFKITHQTYDEYVNGNAVLNVLQMRRSARSKKIQFQKEKFYNNLVTSVKSNANSHLNGIGFAAASSAEMTIFPLDKKLSNASFDTFTCGIDWYSLKCSHRQNFSTNSINHLNWRTVIFRTETLHKNVSAIPNIFEGKEKQF